MSTLLDTQLNKIENKYRVLAGNPACAHGWRFLYTPRNTMTCPNGLMFLGLNPKGNGSNMDIIQWVEGGNAYRDDVEKWRNPLKEQVNKFFQILAQSRLGGRAAHDATRLMDETLTSNFCPFRTPSWAEFRPIDVRNDAVAFSTNLWTEIFREIGPRVRIIFCMGSTQYPHLRGILGSIASKFKSEVLLPTGWGNQKYAIQQFMFAGQYTALARIPHLSRYKLLNSNYAAGLNAFFDRLSASAI